MVSAYILNYAVSAIERFVSPKKHTASKAVGLFAWSVIDEAGCVSSVGCIHVEGVVESINVCSSSVFGNKAGPHERMVVSGEAQLTRVYP